MSFISSWWEIGNICVLLAGVLLDKSQIESNLVGERRRDIKIDERGVWRWKVWFEGIQRISIGASRFWLHLALEGPRIVHDTLYIFPMSSVSNQVIRSCSSRKRHLCSIAHSTPVHCVSLVRIFFSRSWTSEFPP